jgi:aminopeptidase N
LISDYGQNKPLAIPKEYIAALQHTLRTMQDDKWLLSVLLTLPCEKYLTEQMTFIDTDTAHQVHEFVLYEIAYACKDLLLEIYNKYHDANKPYQFTMDEVGRRSLKNLCLYYLMQLHDADIELLGLQQFQTALRTNMTDTMAALAAFANLDSMMRESVLMNFYQVWHEDALAVNKWFAIQAASRLPNTLKQVKKLLAHPAFDLKNPNKVYALIGTFTNNLACFHHNNGLGYEFLADIVLELNVLNPQIAARMVKPLTAWKRYDINRQNLMRDQLLRIINTQNISQDVYELVTKSLGEA